MITVSDKAKTILQKKTSEQDSFVRITVTSGGCAGMTYDAVLDDSLQEDDKIILKEDGLTIVTDDDSLPYMYGLNIDYSDDLITAGFRFNNGNNKSSCGCGASFSVSGFPALGNNGASCGS